jgi:hypothetical protein
MHTFRLLFSMTYCDMFCRSTTVVNGLELMLYIIHTPLIDLVFDSWQDFWFDFRCGLCLKCQRLRYFGEEHEIK